MRIYDQDNNRLLKYFILLFTLDEAKQVINGIMDLNAKQVMGELKGGEFITIRDEKHNRELKITIYSPLESLEGYDQVSRKIIEKDEL